MGISGTDCRGYVLRAADRYYQNIFYNNVEYGPGRTACTAAKVDCPKCGDWRQPKIWYPSIDCSALMRLGEGVSKHLYPGDTDLRQEPFDPEEFKVFAGLVAPELGPSRPVVPGMVCGVWPGWATEKIGDFAWRSESHPMVRESVFRAMLDAGFAIAGGATPIRARRELGEELIQLEIPPVARLSVVSGFSRCSICGKFDPPERSMLDAVLRKSGPAWPTVIDAASFDDSIPFQRVLEWPETIIVTTALAEFVKSRNFSDIALEPAEFG